MTMAAERPAEGSRAQPREEVLYPQSSGPDGMERLRKAWARPRGLRAITEVQNTWIGPIYIATGFAFFLAAGVLALVMRVQLAVPHNTVLDAQTYNQFFTMHGTAMMFLFAVPIVEAFAVYMLPAMVGTRDMPFPWLSAFGYWCYAIGGVFVFSSVIFGIAPEGGWFMYPPLTGTTYSPGINTEIWILGLGFVEIAAIAAAVELIVGILKTRAPGMSLAEMPIFAWYMLITAGMIMLGMPAVIAADILLELERGLNMPFYDPTRGGDPLLWQHLFWLFGHPEVYIIFLPAAGMVSMMLPTFARTPLVGYTWVVVAAVAIGFISFGLWAHHMYATGLPRLSLSFFAAASSAIAIPMGIQVFAWLATLWEGRPVLRAPLLFILGFLFIFTVGGLTGVMVAAVPYDWQVHDSYFVVAHFHYVLIGGMVFPLFAAFYYWTSLFSGRLMSERVAKWVFWLMFIGFNGSFFPMHFTGLRGMPRRVYVYADGLGWNALNMVSTVFAFVFAAGVLVFIVDFLRHLRRGEEAGNDPWNAPSLEFFSGSKPEGFRSLPVITSRYPLWDRPQLRADIEEGRGFLPDAPTLARESLITSSIRAEPEQIIRLPGPGWTPFAAAASAAAFFIATTFKSLPITAASAVVCVSFILYWLWNRDNALPRQLADAGCGVALPLYRNGSESIGWWGMAVFLVSDAAVTASFIFSYLFLWASQPTAWPPGEAGITGSSATAIAAIAVAIAYLAFEAAERANRADWRFLVHALLLACAVVAAAGAWAGWSWIAATGLDPTAHAYGAATWMLLGWAAMHVGIGAGMALWCLARSSLGMLDSWRSLTLRVCLLWWRATVASGALVLLLIVGFPYATRG